jgi:cytidylate kinase
MGSPAALRAAGDSDWTTVIAPAAICGREAYNVPGGVLMIITIGRQIATGAGELGCRLAQRLGYVCIDHQIVQEAARHLGVREQDLRQREERICRFWQRFAGVLAVGPPDGVYATLPVIPEIPDKTVCDVQSQVIRELTLKGDAVVIGHGAFHVLRDRPDLLKIFAHAATEYRLRRLATCYKITDPVEARKTLERTDRDRELFTRNIAGSNWMDARNYDLCIDLGRVSMPLAEEMVIGLVKERENKVASC